MNMNKALQMLGFYFEAGQKYHQNGCLDWFRSKVK